MADKHTFKVGDRVMTNDDGFYLRPDQKTGTIIHKYSDRLFDVELDNYGTPLAFYPHEMFHLKEETHRTETELLTDILAEFRQLNKTLTKRRTT